MEIAAKVPCSDDLLVVLGTDVRKSVGDHRSAFDLPALAIPARGSSAKLSPGAACRSLFKAEHKVAMPKPALRSVLSGVKAEIAINGCAPRQIPNQTEIPA